MYKQNTATGTYVDTESRAVLREVFPLEDAEQADRAPTKRTSRKDIQMRLTTHSVQDALDLRGGDIYRTSRRLEGNTKGTGIGFTSSSLRTRKSRASSSRTKQKESGGKEVEETNKLLLEKETTKNIEKNEVQRGNTIISHNENVNSKII
ncbi:hypothetical protein FB451DRAFT_1178867 [Mycena latifolia]|nr:hypothetical protein FB451DRAFT_1178867 [Mycena latifolia]